MLLEESTYNGKYKLIISHPEYNKNNFRCVDYFAFSILYIIVMLLCRLTAYFFVRDGEEGILCFVFSCFCFFDRSNRCLMLTYVRFGCPVISEILEDDIIYYEPPRGDARKIVVTIFNTSIESLPSILALKSEKKREGFSTKGFAAHHKLGLPVAVTFFNIETSEANRASAPKPKRNKSTN